jgi:hypothetical protein
MAKPALVLACDKPSGDGAHVPSLPFRANVVESGVLWKVMRYSIRRSTKDRTIHLVFEEAGFDDLPEHVRLKGPWQHLKSGEFENLRPDYLKAINAHRYVIVEQSAAVFSAEI